MGRGCQLGTVKKSSLLSPAKARFILVSKTSSAYLTIRIHSLSNCSKGLTSAKISSSQLGSFRNLSLRSFAKMRLRNVLPHKEPFPAAASLICRIGFKADTVYEIKSTVLCVRSDSSLISGRKRGKRIYYPPPASQTTNVSPILMLCGSIAWRAYTAAASGSDITCNLLPLPMPAFSAQARVLAFAASDHIAGIVIIHSLGVVRRTTEGNF